MIELAERLLSLQAAINEVWFSCIFREESGLIGSKYFADNPLIDLTNVNA
jgi:Zn-dependent M28 family amino/carboxypeptidase